VPEYRTDLPRPGDRVLAIGSPLGLDNTVTAGIVSALDREVPGSAAQTRALVDLIQVDAAISPGNSGGALLDASGRVIGINEAYLPPATGAVSLGFAIPAATAVDVAEQLLADGTATHPYLGVSLGRLTEQIRRQLGVAADSGALVLAVDLDGPAATAGVRAGDVLVGLADRDVDTVEELLGALRDTEPGQQVPLTVARGPQEVTATVTIGSITG
jgi:S1-C subfamily serine protease